MEPRYELYAGLPPEPVLTALANNLASVFTNQSAVAFITDLRYQHGRTGLHTWLAFSDEEIIGCKLGYERKPGHFYSWLGCVSAAHRGRGIAAELMRRQHEWCRQQGYGTIRTQTYNLWRQMLLLNLRFGFDIIGTVQGQHGLTLVLEKAL